MKNNLTDFNPSHVGIKYPYFALLITSLMMIGQSLLIRDLLGAPHSRALGPLGPHLWEQPLIFTLALIVLFAPVAARILLSATTGLLVTIGSISLLITTLLDMIFGSQPTISFISEFGTSLLLTLPSITVGLLGLSYFPSILLWRHKQLLKDSAHRIPFRILIKTIISQPRYSIHPEWFLITSQILKRHPQEVANAVLFISEFRSSPYYQQVFEFTCRFIGKSIQDQWKPRPTESWMKAAFSQTQDPIIPSEHIRLPEVELFCKHPKPIIATFSVIVLTLGGLLISSRQSLSYSEKVTYQCSKLGSGEPADFRHLSAPSSEEISSTYFALNRNSDVKDHCRRLWIEHIRFPVFQEAMSQALTRSDAIFISDPETKESSPFLSRFISDLGTQNHIEAFSNQLLTGTHATLPPLARDFFFNLSTSHFSNSLVSSLLQYSIKRSDAGFLAELINRHSSILSIVDRVRTGDTVTDKTIQTLSSVASFYLLQVARWEEGYPWTDRNTQFRSLLQSIEASDGLIADFFLKFPLSANAQIKNNALQSSWMDDAVFKDTRFWNVIRSSISKESAYIPHIVRFIFQNTKNHVLFLKTIRDFSKDLPILDLFYGPTHPSTESIDSRLQEYLKENDPTTLRNTIYTFFSVLETFLSGDLRFHNSDIFRQWITKPNSMTESLIFHLNQIDYDGDFSITDPNHSVKRDDRSKTSLRNFLLNTLPQALSPVTPSEGLALIILMTKSRGKFHMDLLEEKKVRNLLTQAASRLVSETKNNGDTCHDETSLESFRNANKNLWPALSSKFIQPFVTFNCEKACVCMKERN